MTQPGVGVSKDRLVVVIYVEKRAHSLSDQHPSANYENGADQQNPVHVKSRKNTKGPAQIK